MTSDCTHPSLNQLLLEIVYGIFYYLDVSDILRMRRVSRHLNTVSHSKDVWRNAYRTAEFVRPPGPFISQSAQDLEAALVPSFRVDRNLRCSSTSNTGARTETQVVKSKEIRYTCRPLSVSMVFGQFLLIAFLEEIYCYDLNIEALDTQLGVHVIYRSPACAILQSFHCVSAFDLGGRPMACIVICEEMRGLGRPSIAATRVSAYSLNVVEQSEMTLDLLYQNECMFPRLRVASVDLGPRVLVLVLDYRTEGGETNWHVVGLDVHTRTQLPLPCSMHEVEEAAKFPSHLTFLSFPPSSISTSTHLLIANSSCPNSETGSRDMFCQAFALPHTTTYSAPLTPSHRAIIPCIGIKAGALLQDAVVDASTQHTLIAIRVNATGDSTEFSKKYGILRLGTPDHMNEPGSITFQLLGSFPGYSFCRPSFNGTVRTCDWTFERKLREIVVLEQDLGSSTCCGDENDRSEVDNTRRFFLPLPHDVLDYDPYSGRLCLWRKHSRGVIEIYDLAV